MNVDRQCDRVGICEHWPGKATGPGILTTPWAVDPADNVAKYYALSGLTFKTGTQLDVAKAPPADASTRAAQIRTEEPDPSKRPTRELLVKF